MGLTGPKAVSESAQVAGLRSHGRGFGGDVAPTSGQSISTVIVTSLTLQPAAWADTRVRVYRGVRRSRSARI